MGDVIDFPTKNHSREDEQRWLENVQLKKRIYIDSVIEGYGSSLLNRFALLGFNIEDDDFIYDFIFVMEMMKSTLCKNVGIDHELYKVVQKQAEKYYTSDS